MPLFECSKCHAVDNTALTNFWWDTEQEKKPPLCSECDPTIGEWHKRFPRRTAEEFKRLFPKDKIDFPWEEKT